MSYLEKFESLRIPLEDIISATNNFAPENAIEVGDFHDVYKGELPRSEGLITVAVKRLGIIEQGKSEFLMEVSLLGSVEHANLVSLVGYCDEGSERIIVHEYLTFGSLDKYLSRPKLTWTKRLEICVDAARGLNYLHNGLGTNYRIVHRDIRSTKILLDRGLNAKIANFGLSTNRPKNLPFTFLLTAVVGPIGYVDPSYISRGILTSESDIYSFGVVLFEVLSGRLATDVGYEDESRFLGPLARRCVEDGKLDQIIDPILRKQMNLDSLAAFQTVAYQCLEDNRRQRPSMSRILERLEESLKLQREFDKELPLQHVARGKPTVRDDFYKAKNLEHWQISYDEIESATHGFRRDHRIGGGAFGGVYRAELFHFDVRKDTKNSEADGLSMVELFGYLRRKGKVAIKKLDISQGQGMKEFLQEIEVLSSLKHQNLISLLGFCDQDTEMILIYEHAVNGSLDKCIRNVQGEYTHTWEQRLQICLDAAQGLRYLHDCGVIHRDIKSANILLGPNWEGIIGDLGLSKTSKHENHEFPGSVASFAGTPGYLHPDYARTGKLTKAADIYSFGVFMLEVLCGRLSIPPTLGDQQEYLIHFAERHFRQNKLYELIDPYLKKTYPFPDNGTFLESISTFAAITYKCLHNDQAHNKLTMADVVKELKRAWTFHLTGVEMISLEGINSATNCFSDDRVIGKGATSKVYVGQLPLSKGSTMVAMKRLDMVGSYQEGEFFKEVALLSRYIHDNIIPLRGFCEEENEKIIVFEHAKNESLDKHLESSILTWELRLKISIAASYGLHYLHSCVEPENTVHGDIKSGNVLVDHDWKATISDFVISKSEGTLGYLDPQYCKTGVLTQESDVFSFGVVLFEILTGKLAIQKAEKYPQTALALLRTDEPEISPGGNETGNELVFISRLAALCFEKGSLDTIVFKDIMDQTDAKSIDTFAAIAYRCLDGKRKKRPLMAEVLKELEKALKLHEEWDWEQKLPRDYNSLIQRSKNPVESTITKKDLHSLLSSGILLPKEKVWFSINMNGEKNEMVSAKRFSYKNACSLKWRSIAKSRFPKVAKIVDISNLDIQIKIKSQFLSLGVKYGAYLVFKFCDRRKVSSRPLYVNLTFTKEGERFNAYFAEWREGNEWLMVELFEFLNNNEQTDIDVTLESFSDYYWGNSTIFLEGIEFRAIHIEDDKANKELKDEKIVRGLLKSTLHVDWEEQLESDYRKIFKRSQYNIEYPSKEELYFFLSKGILIDNGEKFFSLSGVDGKKCHMLPAKVVMHDYSNVRFCNRKPPTQSRFAKVVEILSYHEFRIKCNIETKMLSPDTSYACFLVFKLSAKCRGLQFPVKAQDLLPYKKERTKIISFSLPSLMNLRKIKWIPQEREDGWMEVIVWETILNNGYKDEYVPMDIKLASFEGTMSGLIVCGIEFRPI